MIPVPDDAAFSLDFVRSQSVIDELQDLEFQAESTQTSL